MTQTLLKEIYISLHSGATTLPIQRAPSDKNLTTMAYTKLIYHIVLRTHQGTAPIIEEHERELYMYIFGFCKQHKCILYRINGMPDHIHLLVSLHPTIAVAAFVHDLKIATSNLMKSSPERYPGFKGWENGYCALTYSDTDKETVRQYIINQKSHHAHLSARDELVALLQEFGIEFDTRYI